MPRPRPASKVDRSCSRRLFGDSGVFALSGMETLAHLGRPCHRGSRPPDRTGACAQTGFADAAGGSWAVRSQCGRHEGLRPGQPGPARRTGTAPLPARPEHRHADQLHQGKGRPELAQAIASPNNPLTARVFVNRVWAWQFGHVFGRHLEQFRQARRSPDASRTA